jgi:hypothetical protein
MILKARSPVNRAFAAFLVARAVVILANRINVDLGPATGSVSWDRIAGYASLAVVPLVLYFLLVYMWPRKQGWRQALQAAPLAVGLAALLAYSVAPCLNACLTPRHWQALGPLSLVSQSYGLAYAAVALVLALEGTRREPGPRREAAYLLSAAFALNSVLTDALTAGNVLSSSPFPSVAGLEPSLWTDVFMASSSVALLVSLAALGAYAVLALREPRSRQKVTATCVAAVAAGLCGAWIGAGLAPAAPGAFILGLWRGLLAALPAYALVRHRLFDLDVKLRWTIRRGTVALAFLAMFFMVSQVAQSYLTSEYGWGVGGVAAGLLLFGLSPLERLGGRLADAIVPHQHPEARLSLEGRKSLFLAQARMAWEDGALDRNERRLLENLRQRLGLSAADAASLEHQAVIEIDPA